MWVVVIVFMCVGGGGVATLFISYLFTLSLTFLCVCGDVTVLFSVCLRFHLSFCYFECFVRI